MEFDISDYRKPLFLYSHEFIFFGTIKCHDVNTFEALDNFTVRMIQCRAHHIAAYGDFNFTLGVLDQNGTVKGNQNSAGESF